MKTSTIILFFNLFFLQQTPEYKRLYLLGFNFYKNKDFASAIVNFKKSYKEKRNYQTAYYIAVNYANLRNCDSCKKFAMLVVSAGSGAISPYIIESNKMINSCLQLQKVITIRTSGQTPPCPPCEPDTMYYPVLPSKIDSLSF